jgi:MFS transporter, DHA2 family, multidrug resistance protein
MLATMAMYAFGSTTVAHGVGWLTLLVIVYRASFGFVYTPLTSVILTTLPPDRLSMGSGLDGIHRGFGSAFGIALGSLLVERRTAAHLIALGEQHEWHNLSVQEATMAVQEVLTAAGMGPGTTAALAVLEEHLHEEAQIAAYQDTFLLLGMLTLLALPPALLVRHRRRAAGGGNAM